MNDNRNNIDPERNKEDLKAWINSHSQEYGEVALEMSESDLLETFIMGQAAFITSPEFQKRLEDMVDTDSVNVGELVEILHQDMGNRIGDWLKYNRRGIDLARLYVALVEADEVTANLTVTRFMNALKPSFP